MKFVFIGLLLILFLYQANAYAVSPYVFVYHGQRYSLPLEITNGVVTKIERDDLGVNVLRFHIQTTGDGILSVSIPRILLDAHEVTEIEDFSVFIDDRKVQFKEVGVECGVRRLEIPFEKGSNEIDVIGTSFSGGNTLERTVTLCIISHGQDFPVLARTNSLIGMYEFTESEKKLRINIEDGDHVILNIPKRFLNGDFTVKTNSKITTQFNVTNLEGSSIIAVNYTADTKTVDIIGTTAIPEFPISILVASVAMMTTLLALRLKKSIRV